jgi:hypothetical protein
MDILWKAVAKLQERTMRDLSTENDMLQAEQALQSALIDVADKENKRLKSEYLTLWDEFCVMRDRNVGLEKSVNELQRWKDAVPVAALVKVVDAAANDGFWLQSIDEWIASLTQPDVQTQPADK